MENKLWKWSAGTTIVGFAITAVEKGGYFLWAGITEIILIIIWILALIKYFSHLHTQERSIFARDALFTLGFMVVAGIVLVLLYFYLIFSSF